ncbi:HipA domain-containing protein [Caulobacter sp. DWP3-1-3b2]|uniref:HipA domain-containing protein n=1 Tax=Caulobacter sp. DWP3-1-3b2 TaxID=2804643 RepID=UPI003CF30971
MRRAGAEPARDARELFRRMAFNALISNADDHPRNHAMIAKARDWRLSPAYDLAPSTPIRLERRDLALVIGDAGRIATAENLISQSPRFLLKTDEAAAIVADMERRVNPSRFPVGARCSRGEILTFGPHDESLRAARLASNRRMRRPTSRAEVALWRCWAARAFANSSPTWLRRPR